MARKVPGAFAKKEPTPGRELGGHTPKSEIKKSRSKNGASHLSEDEHGDELLPSVRNPMRKYPNDPEVEVTRKIFAVIGSTRAAEWMHSEVPSLRNRTPLSLIGTAEGREEVERVLGRIENGIF